MGHVERLVGEGEKDTTDPSANELISQNKRVCARRGGILIASLQTNGSRVRNTSSLQRIAEATVTMPEVPESRTRSVRTWRHVTHAGDTPRSYLQISDKIQ